MEIFEGQSFASLKALLDGRLIFFGNFNALPFLRFDNLSCILLKLIAFDNDLIKIEIEQLKGGAMTAADGRCAELLPSLLRKFQIKMEMAAERG